VGAATRGRVTLMAASIALGVAPPPAATRGRRVAVRLARTLAFTVLSLAVAFGLWQAIIDVLNLNPYFAKGPLDVYDFLFTGSGAGSSRSTLFAALLVTLRDAGLGFAAGTIAAILVAIGVVLRKGVEQTLMPVAIALRSVPLVAMTPLLTLIFGQGLLAVTIIAGIVTFFPSLVNLVQGLRAVPAQSFDVLAAYGANELTTLRKVQLPYALPSLFTAARIAAPGALLGAVLAEWLATGKGLGALMVTSSATSQYDMLWAAVVVITVVSVLIYNTVTTVESPVLARFGAVGR
jgi:ABC-type nitrate/sulfonate/bicarbonate transport system permease component